MNCITCGLPIPNDELCKTAEGPVHGNGNCIQLLRAKNERLSAQVETLTDERDNYRIVLVSKVTGELFERSYFARPDARNWSLIFAGGIEEVADEALDRCHRGAEQMAKDG